MTTARNVKRGQSIRVGGRTVKVTRSELDLDGRWSISYKAGSRSGMHRCPPGKDVKTVYTPPAKPKWWSW